MSLLADIDPQDFTGRASTSERVIRVAVCERIRALLPEARIVHELPVWGRRADLAAIEPERITLFEIKSERDNLKRCEDQMEAFGGSSHHAVLVAHEKWFDRTPYNNGAPRLVWPSDEYLSHSIWCYPEPPEKWLPFSHYHWKLPAPTIRQPPPSRLLEILWRPELLAECKRHGIAASPRATCRYMIDQMAYHMSGRDIARAVCRQLRARSFPTADKPITYTPQ